MFSSGPLTGCKMTLNIFGLGSIKYQNSVVSKVIRIYKLRLISFIYALLQGIAAHFLI